VEGRPGEGVDAGHGRQRRLDQAAAAADDDVGGQLAPVGRQPPQQRLVVPGAGEQLGVAVQVRQDAELLRDVLQVGADLGWRLNECDHDGLVAKENEYRWLGTSQAQPG
jgi:hypothetical protein